MKYVYKFLAVSYLFAVIYVLTVKIDSVMHFLTYINGWVECFIVIVLTGVYILILSAAFPENEVKK